MRTPPLLADFIHPRNCKPICEKLLTLPACKEYKKLLELICRNEEKLQVTMTDEQKELFSRYTDAVREYQMTTDCLIFQNGFKLGARMMLEVMEE